MKASHACHGSNAADDQHAHDHFLDNHALLWVTTHMSNSTMHNEIEALSVDVSLFSHDLNVRALLRCTQNYTDLIRRFAGKRGWKKFVEGQMVCIARSIWTPSPTVHNDRGSAAHGPVTRPPSRRMSIIIGGGTIKMLASRRTGKRCDPSNLRRSRNITCREAGKMLVETRGDMFGREWHAYFGAEEGQGGGG